jgi:hypothetical protein
MVLVVLVNVKLNYRPALTVDKEDTLNLEPLKELRGLKYALNNNADLKTQRIYPEGYVFLNAIYALAWCNFLRDHKNGSFFLEGRDEVRKAWQKINSPPAKARFNEELPFRYGSFYNGWNAYVLGSKLNLELRNEREPAEVDSFKLKCSRISTAIQEKVYPMSYAGSSWPADVVVCVAALSLHDRLFEPEYEVVIRDWMTKVKERLDTSGMLPHSVRPFDGKIREGARGSSQALMLIFLREIDEPFATDQFKLFQDRFIDTRFGLTGVREYPKGVLGAGDVDSGPLVLGFGGAATIVGMQTLSRFEEIDSSIRIRKTVEALAFASQGHDDKKYFFGQLPIADAFIAWSHSNMSPTESAVSFFAFRVYSVVAFMLLAIFFWILVSHSNPDSKRALNVTW